MPPADEGRTKVAPRAAAPTPEVTAADASSEKTRMPPRKSVDDGKTRVAATGQVRPQTPVVDEKTRVASGKPDDEEKTRMAVRKLALAPEKVIQDIKPDKLAQESGDKTRFAASQKPAGQVKSDITAITENRNTADANTIGYVDPEQQAYPILKNRFVFEELLGTGGMGAV